MKLQVSPSAVCVLRILTTSSPLLQKNQDLTVQLLICRNFQTDFNSNGVVEESMSIR